MGFESLREEGGIGVWPSFILLFAPAAFSVALTLFHILLDPEVNIGGLHLENLCSYYVSGKKVRQRENPNHTEVAEICF